MAAVSHPYMLFWRQRVQEWYPEFCRRSYFLPPVFMNRSKHQVEQIAGQTVYVTEPPLSDVARGAPRALHESFVREDATQVKVLRCLHQLSETQGEVMFVISQLNFGHYLNQPAYAAAASALPRPIDLKAQNKDRGDFDVLIIHRLYGILVGEIKTIGDMLSSLTQEERDKKIADKVKQMIRQLQKADYVLGHVMSDQSTPPRILKTLMLPNVTTAQLQAVLTADPQLSLELCQCLGVTCPADPSLLCLTADILNNPGPWWQQWVTGAGPDSAMTDAMYLDLISRFSGPATTVTVPCTTLPRLYADIRTEGEGASETGWQFTQLVLHPNQLSMLHSSKRLVFLTGPPGCGKSLVLLLKALDWLSRVKPVQLISTDKGSLAASYMIYGQLQQLRKPGSGGRLPLHIFDLQTNPKQAIKAAVKTLMTCVQDGELYVISDEVSTAFDNLVIELLGQCPQLQIWAASLWSTLKPLQLTEYLLSEPLRTPPSITREVEQCDYMSPSQGTVHGYTAASAPLPSDGPAVRAVRHSTPGHSAGKTYECRKCGEEVARVLQELHVGGTGSYMSPAPPPLRFHDVFLLSSSSDDLHDTERDASGKVTRPASGLLQGVRQAGVPVTVVKPDDVHTVADVATMSGADHVIASDVMTVSGLERKVVVFVETNRMGDEEFGRLFAMSRCTAQLVLVKPR